MKNFGHKKQIKTNEAKSYMSACEALEDNNLIYVGKFWNKNPVSGKTIKREIFEDKNKRLWAFVGMDHFNTTIYSITVKRFLGLKKDLDF